MDVRTALIAFILSVNLHISASQCNGSPTILEGNGTVQSPNYGNERGKKADCTWRINGSLNSVIVLRLISLDIFEVNRRRKKKACSNSLMLKIHSTKMDCKEDIHENNSMEAKCYAFPYQCKIMPLFGNCERENETESVTVEYLKKKKLSHLGRNIKGFKIEHTNIRCQNEKNETTVTDATPDAASAGGVPKGVIYGLIAGAVGFTAVVGVGVAWYFLKRRNMRVQASHIRGHEISAIRPELPHRNTPVARDSFSSFDSDVDPPYEDIHRDDISGYEPVDGNQIEAVTYASIRRAR